MGHVEGINHSIFIFIYKYVNLHIDVLVFSYYESARENASNGRAAWARGLCNGLICFLYYYISDYKKPT